MVFCEINMNFKEFKLQSLFSFIRKPQFLANPTALPNTVKTIRFQLYQDYLNGHAQLEFHHQHLISCLHPPPQDHPRFKPWNFSSTPHKGTNGDGRMKRLMVPNGLSLHLKLTLAMTRTRFGKESPAPLPQIFASYNRVRLFLWYYIITI
jgi:hypothetical protein